MPELPEVEVVVRGLQKKIAGAKITGVKLSLPKIVAKGRRAFGKTLQHLTIQHVRRRGKYIIIELSKDRALIFHLKMTGQLTIVKISEPQKKHTHVIIDLSGSLQLRFCDIRQFGRVYLIKQADILRLKQISALGPEANKVSQAYFLKNIAKRKGRVKSLLLNQEFLAGIGNIYCDEALYQAKIHPLTPANKIPEKKRIALHQAILEILTAAIKHGGSSVENYLNSQGKPGHYQKKHKVYRRVGQPCRSCHTPINRIKIGGRSSSFCPNCQPKPKNK